MDPASSSKTVSVGALESYAPEINSIGSTNQSTSVHQVDIETSIDKSPVCENMVQAARPITQGRVSILDNHLSEHTELKIRIPECVETQKNESEWKDDDEWFVLAAGDDAPNYLNSAVVEQLRKDEPELFSDVDDSCLSDIMADPYSSSSSAVTKHELRHRAIAKLVYDHHTKGTLSDIFGGNTDNGWRATKLCFGEFRTNSFVKEDIKQGMSGEVIFVSESEYNAKCNAEGLEGKVQMYEAEFLKVQEFLNHARTFLLDKNISSEEKCGSMVSVLNSEESGLSCSELLERMNTMMCKSANLALGAPKFRKREAELAEGAGSTKSQRLEYNQDVVHP